MVFIQIINRLFDVLEVLSEEKDGLGVTEIGFKTGLHKSTVHRLLTSLSERGYVEKTSEKGIYKIGVKVMELASLYLTSVELKSEVRPLLWELASTHNFVCHLAILDNLEAVYIDKVDYVYSTNMYSQIGKRIPIHCSALGKALVSSLSKEILLEKFKDYNFKVFTQNTIDNLQSFIHEIVGVKKLGWSIDNEEHEESIKCFASPIFDYKENIIAAISISGSANNMSMNNEELGELVRNAAIKISSKLGYN